MSLRVLVCGGRDYADRERVHSVLARFRDRFGILMLIHGGAKGADNLAAAWADWHRVPCLCVPADWERLGRAAGAERNALMLNLGQPDRVLAFPGGSGTANMVKQARASGVEVIEIPPRPAPPPHPAPAHEGERRR